MRHKIVQQLRRERRAAEMTQDSLSLTLGKSLHHICDLESGKHSPRLELIDAWANALGYELALVKKQ